MTQTTHVEKHYGQRIGWLRAAVLGAIDGIVSTASLVVGVAAAESGRSDIPIAGIAGLVAGAMSMAAGEYVSVSSQSDTERADLARERREHEASPERELRELQEIYMQRGLDADLALRVAQQLTAHDALAAHGRDELGFSAMHAARPVQAALASGATFAVGAALPLVVATLVPERRIIVAVAVSSLLFLAGPGSLAARAGGAGTLRGALRVTFLRGRAPALSVGGGNFGGSLRRFRRNWGDPAERRSGRAPGEAGG